MAPLIFIIDINEYSVQTAFQDGIDFFNKTLLLYWRECYLHFHDFSHYKAVFQEQSHLLTVSAGIY